MKETVEANAKIAKTALYAVAAVATMAANPIAMSDAAAAWTEIANDLGTMASHLDSALGKGDDWIADDKDAFADSLTNFKGEIEQFRNSLSDLSGVLDLVSNAYLASYVALAVYALSCIAILLGLMALLVIPHTAPFARAAIEMIGAMLSALAAKMAILLGSLAAAFLTMLGGMTFGWLSLSSKTGVIPSARDFEQIRVNYEAPKEFKVKKAE